MHLVYIIYSPSINRFYVGESAFPNQRVADHNGGKFSKASTLNANDWELKIKINCQNRVDALKVEKYIKSMKSAVFLNKLISSTQFQDGFVQIIRNKLNIIVWI